MDARGEVSVTMFFVLILISFITIHGYFFLLTSTGIKIAFPSIDSVSMVHTQEFHK